jgi:hypothetical protein
MGVTWTAPYSAIVGCDKCRGPVRHGCLDRFPGDGGGVRLDIDKDQSSPTSVTADTVAIKVTAGSSTSQQRVRRPRL